jgi:protein-S-isoprenylcysteine O-methyltransferase Ste14
VAILFPLLLAEQGTLNFWSIYPGLLFLALGLTLYCWSVWDFIFFGRGTPAPIDAPRHLVYKGLYQYTRNPMYVAVLLVILGWAIYFLDILILTYWFFVAICFQLFVQFYEEPKLKHLFSDEYSRYLASVNRWTPKFVRK